MIDIFLKTGLFSEKKAIYCKINGKIEKRYLYTPISDKVMQQIQKPVFYITLILIASYLFHTPMMMLSSLYGIHIIYDSEYALYSIFDNNDLAKVLSSFTGCEYHHLIPRIALEYPDALPSNLPLTFCSELCAILQALCGLFLIFTLFLFVKRKFRQAFRGLLVIIGLLVFVLGVEVIVNWQTVRIYQDLIRAALLRVNAYGNIDYESYRIALSEVNEKRTLIPFDVYCYFSCFGRFINVANFSFLNTFFYNSQSSLLVILQ